MAGVRWGECDEMDAMGCVREVGAMRCAICGE